MILHHSDLVTNVDGSCVLKLQLIFESKEHLEEWIEEQQHPDIKKQIDPLTGATTWKLGKHPFRYDDKPSIVHTNGTMMWTDMNGVLHRAGKPAIIRADGTEEFYTRGKRIK